MENKAPSTIHLLGVTLSFGNDPSEGRKKQLTKEDIGRPYNFRHVSHVGFDCDYDLFKMPEQNSPDNEIHLNDKASGEYVNTLIIKNGEICAFKKKPAMIAPPAQRARAPMPLPRSKALTLPPQPHPRTSHFPRPLQPPITTE